MASRSPVSAGSDSFVIVSSINMSTEKNNNGYLLFPILSAIIKLVKLLFSMANKIEPTGLAAFGLSPRQESVYVSLLAGGPMTPLQLSRQSGLNRTTLYRILDSLLEMGLAEKMLDRKSARYTASPPDRLDFRITRMEADVARAREALPGLITRLSALTPPTASPTRVLHYRGREGLKQILYHTLESKTEVIGFGYGNWNDGVGRIFAEKLRSRVVERRIRAREILNSTESVKSFTRVPDYFKYYQNRFIDPKILTITHDTYIYDDVFAFYHFFRGDIFGVEMVNSEITRTQKQIFDIIWEIARPSGKSGSIT
ncbi:hypothetical protein A2Z33_02165 [Candidatus Gottesmanbacteria bacterium RBG_16_52_11]|uniref:Transcription regulator TrmB N-terminal domain-containing protein n=1 Tax=Candidatus Gottesmanbacteria bacterium RBG_16_52_11 TaxID=1798374 RepID=A0A1F5YRR7_9BACT|nr:MAG: hypothetical protein A2Z33_02165 [Candidatus Gottesmanbacteria bacterium RBG_16_52_11]